MICPKCGAYSPEESNFCCNCATALISVLPEVPSVAEEIPEQPGMTAEESYEPVAGAAEDTAEQAAAEETTEQAAAEERVEAFPDEAAAEAPPPPKKGRLWVPMVILVAMFALGLTVFLLTRSYNATVTDPNSPWFTLRGGELYFDASLYTGSNELEVPASIGGQTVTAIAPGCFYDCDELTIVFLPNTVKTIGDCAFENCGALRGIYIPESTASVGSNAFYGCGALESVFVPQTVERIGSNAFSGCNSLRYIFYTGTYQAWTQLYTEFIGPEAYVYASDTVAPSYPGD